MVVDIYDQRAHLQEVETGYRQDESSYLTWVEGVGAATSEVLGIPSSDVVFKRRQRQRGLSQYEKTGAAGKDFVVSEGGLRFIVNLEQYLDTGLFLDHRHTRAMVRDQAAGKRFLNLFAYTGSFSVYAAAGGAFESVTVDLSNTYQSWARRNFELNSMDLTRHELVREDVFAYLDRAVRERRQFGLIVMDPPTFSNSKAMAGVLDVQRDHGKLINQCLRLLILGGRLFFSTNLRSFKLAEQELEACRLKEISHLTVPEDFRNKKIHRCWLLEKI